MESGSYASFKTYQGSTEHKALNIVAILFSIVTFLVAITFNAMAGSGAFVPSIFLSTTGNQSDKYELYITPDGFTFTIWGIIYFWITAALLILIISIFVSTKYGRVYISPEFASIPVCLAMISNFILNLAWIFLWDRSYIVAAAVVLFLIVVTNIAVIALQSINVHKYKDLYARGEPLFIWGILYRLIINGFCVYLTWTIIASLINLTTALVYSGELDIKACCLAALSLLVLFHVTWFILENFLFDNYVRWILTPYMVVIWAAAGIYRKKKDDDSTPHEIKNFTLAIIIIASITLAIRLAIVAFRTIREWKSHRVSSMRN